MKDDDQDVELCKRIISFVGWLILLALFGACEFLISE